MNPSKAKNLETLFPILCIDAETDIIVSKNADLTMAFALELPEIYALSESEYNAIHDVFVRAVRLLPVGYMVHKQDFFVEASYQTEFEREYLLANNYIAWENELHFAERPYLDHRTYLYVTRPAVSPLKRTTTNSSLLKRHLVPRDVQDYKTWAEFIDLVTQFQAIFNDSGKLRLHRLNREQLIGDGDETSLYQKYFSLHLNDPTLYDVDMTNGLKVAGKHTHTYAISELDVFPTEVFNQVRLEQFSTDSTSFPASTGSFLGLLLPFNHIYNQVLYIQDTDSLMNQMVADVKRHHSFATWSKENSVSISAKDQFMEEIKASNRKVIRAHFNVMTFHEDPETADVYRSSLAASISKLGFKPKMTIWDAETLFWSCIPGNIAEIGADNLFTCFAEEALALWNMETNYKDSFFNKNGILMTDRFGKPCMVDLFFKPLQQGVISSRNFMVVGPTGSGKSFTMNNIVYYLLTHGTHVSIVDVGHSYRRLCTALGGRYITNEPDNPISFNPFYFEDLNPNEDTKDALANLMMALWKKDGEGATKSEEVTISNIIHEYYRAMRQGMNEGRYEFACFNSFYDFTKTHYPAIFSQNQGRSDKEFDLQNFLYVIRPYYQGGQYDYLLNSETNIDLVDAPFVIYELDNIKDHPVLFPVTTIMIMNNYVRKLINVKGVLKMLLIEEAWKALAKDSFADFLKWCSKTVRKHYGSLGVVTQEVDDLVGNAIVKDAIINNSPIKLLLDQNNYEKRFPEIMQTLGLSEKQANIILSINKGTNPNRPPHKEMAVILGDRCKVYGVEVSRRSYGTYTTERTDLDAIYLLAEQRYSGDIELAVKGWAQGETV